MEQKCNNGGCSRIVYRGKYCFRCWAGVKWTSLSQRIRKDPSYAGVQVFFTRSELIDWILKNPPPANIEKPSIDRVDPKLGYRFGNIRWLEFSRNCAGANRDIPDGFRRCSGCKETKALNSENFTKGSILKGGFAHYCKFCNRKYQNNWRKNYGKTRK
jgi:hypothetical protein